MRLVVWLKHIGAQVLQRHVEQTNQRKPDDDHHQRGEALMDEYFVDHDLEEEGRHQCEQLDEQRRDQHMGERLAVAPERRQEPSEAEHRRVDARPGEAAGHEDDLAAPTLRKGFRRLLTHAARQRVGEAERPVRRPRADDGEAAILPADDGGKRHGAEPADALALSGGAP